MPLSGRVSLAHSAETFISDRASLFAEENAYIMRLGIKFSNISRTSQVLLLIANMCMNMQSGPRANSGVMFAIPNIKLARQLEASLQFYEMRPSVN